MAETEARDELPIAPCALCIETKRLRKSHIIPNSYFKNMKRQSNGLLIMFDAEPEGDVEKGGDSLWEYLLCANREKVCERLETRWIPGLRVAGKKFMSVDQKVTLADFEYPIADSRHRPLLAVAV